MNENGTAERLAAALSLDDFSHAGDDAAEQLRSSSFAEFVDTDAETKVTVFEARGLDDALTKYTFGTTATLIEHLSICLEPKLRIISIPQYDSYEPLAITKEAMQQVLRLHNVSPDFLAVLYAAGRPPRESEEGFGHAVENNFGDGSFSVTYLSRYLGKRETSWKLRQTAIHHSFSRSTGSNVFLVLQPSEQSDFQVNLESRVGDLAMTKLWLERPTYIHWILFNTYFNNWRPFLQTKGSEFIKSAEKLFALEIKGENYLDIRFEKLQWWRDLEDRMMPLNSIFQAILGVLDVLDRKDRLFTTVKKAEAEDMTPTTDRVQLDLFASRKSTVTALMSSTTGLQRRIHGALSLLADTLALRNQEQLRNINSNLLSLESENVDDNETVKVITIVTLIYLPLSFVATLFGTNLFFFNPHTSHVRIAENFWWYLVICIPLAIVTIATWYFKTRSSRRKRQAKTDRARAANFVEIDGGIRLLTFGRPSQTQLGQV